jgi:hypothetical protein
VALFRSNWTVAVRSERSMARHVDSYPGCNVVDAAGRRGTPGYGLGGIQGKDALTCCGSVPSQPVDTVVMVIMVGLGVT